MNNKKHGWLLAFWLAVFTAIGVEFGFYAMLFSIMILFCLAMALEK